MTTNHIRLDRKTVPGAPCALLWDESLLWGLMAWRALRSAGLPFDLLRAQDIRGGALSRYRMIFVPGGWASNKLSALGEGGTEAVRRFVEAGGGYLGICGGAGLATEGGLGLLPVRRRSPRERVPSFSGPIRLACGRHPVWRGIDAPVFSAWWPSQFQVEDRRVRVLARYEEAQAGAFSSDIDVADGAEIGWPDLERSYGILLDPARLCGEPAVVAGRFGRGRVVLSLVHFDTPGDRNGAVVLGDLWRHLASWDPSHGSGEARVAREVPFPDGSGNIQPVVEEIGTAVAELIAVGARNFLWYWRTPLLLQWRRGVRGLEYATLAVMIGEIERRLAPDASTPEGRSAIPRSVDPGILEGQLAEIREELLPFVEKAKRLLVGERFSLLRGPLSPLDCADPEIGRLREELFGGAMSHGGRFKSLIGRVDRVLYGLLRDQAALSGPE